MSEKDQPNIDKPTRDDIHQQSQHDHFQKGQQGITPPKPQVPQGPGEGGMNEGAPGWTPPKNDE